MNPRPKRGETARRVIAAFDANPGITSTQLGDLLGLNDGYVRAALRRNGRSLTPTRERHEQVTLAPSAQPSTGRD